VPRGRSWVALLMDYKTVSRNPWKTASLALGAAAVVLGMLTFAKVMTLAWGTARAESLVRQAATQDDPNSLQQHLQEAKSAAETLKQKNLFIKRPPKAHPVKQVNGILGSEVLIGDKWYKAGEKVGEATIVAVGPTQVQIAWDGKETTFSPITAASAAPPPAPPAPAAQKGEGPPPKAAPPAPVVAAPPAAAPAPEDPFAWVGVSLSPQLKAKLLERWNQLSAEEKEAWKQRWNGMSDEQKKQTVEALEKGMG
jgi:hypothetical protein